MFTLSVAVDLPSGYFGYCEHPVSTLDELRELLTELAQEMPQCLSEHFEKGEHVVGVKVSLTEFKNIDPRLLSEEGWHAGPRRRGWHVSVCDKVELALDRKSSKQLTAILDKLRAPFMDAYNIVRLVDAIQYDTYDRLIDKKLRQIKEVAKRVKGVNATEHIAQLEAFIEARKEQYQGKVDDLFAMKKDLLETELELSAAIKLIADELAGESQK